VIVTPIYFILGETAAINIAGNPSHGQGLPSSSSAISRPQTAALPADQRPVPNQNIPLGGKVLRENVALGAVPAEVVTLMSRRAACLNLFIKQSPARLVALGANGYKPNTYGSEHRHWAPRRHHCGDSRSCCMDPVWESHKSLKPAQWQSLCFDSLSDILNPTHHDPTPLHGLPRIHSTPHQHGFRASPPKRSRPRRRLSGCQPASLPLSLPIVASTRILPSPLLLLQRGPLAVPRRAGRKPVDRPKSRVCARPSSLLATSPAIFQGDVDEEFHACAHGGNWL
jgi:hypothetical protein